MNEQPYFCCGRLPSEGHTPECDNRHGWHDDEVPDEVREAWEEENHARAIQWGE